MARHALRGIEPFVFRCRRQTVAEADSIGLFVRTCTRCSAGRSQNVESTSWSFFGHVTAWRYLASNISTPASSALCPSARAGAIPISCSISLAFGWMRLGMASSALAVLCSRQHSIRVGGYTCRRAVQKSTAPSPAASLGSTFRAREHDVSQTADLSFADSPYSMRIRQKHDGPVRMDSARARPISPHWSATTARIGRAARRAFDLRRSGPRPRSPRRRWPDPPIQRGRAGRRR